MIAGYHRILTERFISFLQIDHMAVCITLSMFALLLSMGFLVGDVNVNGNYSAFSIFNTKYIWACIFFSYGVFKTLQSIVRCHPILRIFVSISGLWLWTYLAVSFIVFDPTPMAPAEPIILLPIMCEVGYLSSLLYVLRAGSSRRRDSDNGRH
jgi:hypothetical protein